jgi:uncharacterized protein YjbI with pentapeptide repeats
MANEEHLKRLREAIAARNIAAWNKWREENRITPLLGGADLTRADLENADLKEADLRSASLIEANLTGADLSEADLHDAHLYGANLEGANLREANLRGVDLRNADLSRADLTEAKGLSQWQINQAKTNKDTKLPPDLQRLKHWEEDLT